jgi:hypothetical protein
MTSIVPIDVESRNEIVQEVSLPVEDTANTATSSAVAKPRLFYIDKLRTWLTLLVIVHHCFWVVVAGWMPCYRPWQGDNPTQVISCRETKLTLWDCFSSCHWPISPTQRFESVSKG